MRSKLAQLALALPLAAALGVGVPAPANGLELSSAIVADQLTEAFAQGRLPEAQVLVHQMAECNVRAIRINGDVYTINELDGAISAIASGGIAAVPQTSDDAAVFLDEFYHKTAGVVCEVEEVESAALSVPAVPAAPGAAASPAQPPAPAPLPTSSPAAPLDELLAEICAPYESFGVGECPYNEENPPSYEDVVALCERLDLNPCPYLEGETPVPPQPAASPLDEALAELCQPFTDAGAPCPYGPETVATFCESGLLDPCPIDPETGGAPPAAAANTASAGTGEAGAAASADEAPATLLGPAPPVVSGVVNGVLGLLNL